MLQTFFAKKEEQMNLAFFKTCICCNVACNMVETEFVWLTRVSLDAKQTLTTTCEVLRKRSLTPNNDTLVIICWSPQEREELRGQSAHFLCALSPTMTKHNWFCKPEHNNNYMRSTRKSHNIVIKAFSLSLLHCCTLISSSYLVPSEIITRLALQSLNNLTSIECILT